MAVFAHTAVPNDAADSWQASSPYVANVPFSARTPATGALTDFLGRALVNDTLYNFAYPSDQSSGTLFDVTEIAKAEAFNAVSAAASTSSFTGLQTLASVEPGIALSGIEQAVNLGIDLSTADYLVFDFERPDWAWSSIIPAKTFVVGRPGYLDFHAGEYSRSTMVDQATGQFTVRNITLSQATALTRVRAVADADNGFVIPTGTTASTEINVTANAGAVNVNGGASATILEGAGNFNLIIDLPANQQIATISASVGSVVIVSPAAGQVALQVPPAGGDCDLTVTFTAIANVGWVDWTPSNPDNGATIPNRSGRYLLETHPNGTKTCKMEFYLGTPDASGGTAGSGHYFFDFPPGVTPRIYTGFAGTADTEFVIGPMRYSHSTFRGIGIVVANPTTGKFFCSFQTSGATEEWAHNFGAVSSSNMSVTGVCEFEAV